MNPWWMVGAGGAIGSVLRYGFSKILPGIQSGSFPWSTFTVNLIGCFLIGWIYAMLNKQGQQQWAPFLITGLLGGFTTFSAFGLEGLQMIRMQEYGLMALYAGSSLTLGIMLAAAGYWIGS